MVVPVTPGVLKYSYSDLENLWVQAGGNPQAQAMAAAIAMAESAGDTNAVHTNSNGTVDRGLWQINSIHGALSTTDPLANARAAVSISSNGSSWRPWCTAWSNGDCSGTYLGQGSPYQQYLMGDTPPSVGGTTPVSNGTTQTVSLSDPFGFRAGINDFLTTTGMWFWYGLITFIGLIMLALGLYLMWDEFRSGEQARKVGAALSAGFGKSKDIAGRIRR